MRWPENLSIVALALVALAACGAAQSSNGGGDASMDAGPDGPGMIDAPGATDGNAGGCSPACGIGRKCCGNQCVNTSNDPHNCGGCGVVCGGATPFCSGSCQAPPCMVDGGGCGAGASCCGTQCCDSTQICCLPQGPLDRGPACEMPTGNPPTCAQGCAPLCISDRNLKRNVRAVDRQAVLEAVASMPVSTWSYTADDPNVRHMGPMAQDFRAAFGLGDTDRAYNPIDAHGAAFAAIQALYQRMLEQDARIEALERENARLGNACR